MEEQQSNNLNEQRFNTKPASIPAPPGVSMMEEDNKSFVEFIRHWMSKSEQHFKGDDVNLDKRRETNKRFFFGRQVDPKTRTYKGLTGDRALKSYEKPFLDNVLKEGADTIRALILQRLPDLIVKPGTDSNERSKKSAEAITKVVNSAITSRELKKVLTRAFRHFPIYFTGIIKYYWDPQKGKFGDICFEAIHPKNVLVDYTATENNERVMKIIVHNAEKSLKEWILLFPKKKDVLLDFARIKGKIHTGEEDLEKSLAAMLIIPEIWYEWLEKEEMPEGEEQVEDGYEQNYKKVNGVCWLADRGAGSVDDLLQKELNPNWDWEGHEELFFNGQPIPDDVLPQIAMLGMDVPGLERKQVFKNFFGKPRKPFIFLGYEQWGESPYDETSIVEENILLQENYDTRGMQITKMIDDARGKNVFSSLSGLKRETVESMDLDNPDEDLFIDGDLRQVYNFISKEQPSSQMLNDLGRTRERILARIHVNGPTRGEVTSDTATTNQIAREADYTVADDIAEDTINDVATQMAEAILHMMKLRYTPDHFKAVLGELGQEVFDNFTSDVIEDGMEVEIFASGVDKLKAERAAKEDAQLQLIDPLTYYKDTGRSDPEGRAEKLFLFQTNPELYYKKYIQGEDLPNIAEQVMFAAQQRQQQTQVPQGQPLPAQNPMQPSPQNTGAIPTTPQGSPRGLIGNVVNGVRGMLGG